MTADDSVRLPHLETFAQAAELSNFTRAAETLGLTQAAVSQRIRALERTLGVSLFHREHGTVLLTPAGRTLYDYAQKIFTLHKEAYREVAGQALPVTGDLFLAASSVPGEHLLPDALASFRRKYPHVQVRASITDSAAVLEEVEHGRSHLGLVGKKVEHPHLEFRSFACDEMVLIVPAGHALSHRRRVPLPELARHPLILREVGSGSRWCLEQALATAGVSPRTLQIALELGSNEAIKEAVQRGLGIAVLSNQAVQREVQSGALATLTVTGLRLKRDLFLVWDRRRVLPIPARLFLEFLTPCPHQGVTS